MGLHSGNFPPRADTAAQGGNPFPTGGNPALAQGGPPPHALSTDPARPDAARQLILDELMLDGNARLNLATFVTTWMEPQATMLMAETADKNMIDKDEYPRTAELERRCSRMLADLWHAPDPLTAP